MWALTLAMACLANESLVRADTSCGAGQRPWVSIEFGEARWASGFVEMVLSDLRAGFEGRDIDVCRIHSAPSRPPIAQVVVVQQTGERVGVSVEVRDALTQKRISRDVDLAGVPEDGRAFAVALATDELVWASWAELALERKSRQRDVAPKQVVSGVARDLDSSRPPRLAALGAAELHGAGQTLLGADAHFLLDLAQPFELDAGLGLREGLAVSSSNGEVHSNAAVAGVALRYAPWDSQDHRLGLSLGASAAWLWLQGTADPGSTDATLSDVALFARVGAFTGLRLAGPFWLEVAAGAGVPLRGLEATDDGQAVTGAAGIQGFGLLGLAVEL